MQHTLRLLVVYQTQLKCNCKHQIKNYHQNFKILYSVIGAIEEGPLS